MGARVRRTAALGAALVCADRALRLTRPVSEMLARVSPPPKRAVLIMNPRSGGGKVERFDLKARAEALGAEVVLLDATGTADVAAIARQAVAAGADLLGVAGGDGTQALVAEVAAEHDLPFLVVSAGTRNHFAMDLGLDRTDPASCLDALVQGVELRVDLGMVAGRAFVNTVSFGAYAEIVQSPAYRDAKAGTALDALPELLAGQSGARIIVDADDVRLSAPRPCWSATTRTTPGTGSPPAGGHGWTAGGSASSACGSKGRSRPRRWRWAGSPRASPS